MAASSAEVVTDGSISGFIPSSNTFSVYYPGYPLLMSSAITSLGGTDAILKVRDCPSNNLELHFRPEDPYSHPAFGRRQPCNNVLLKLSQPKTNTGLHTLKDNFQDIVGLKQIGSSSESSESEGLICHNESKGIQSDKYGSSKVDLYASVVARVSEAYHFKGMVDYQYVVSKHVEASRERKRKSSEVECHLGNGGVIDQCHEDVMTIVPPLFSLKDVPRELILGSSGTVSLKKKLEGIVHQQWEMDIEPCLGIDFNIEEVPKRVNWEEHISCESGQWAGQMAVSKLFDDRPVWPKKSVNACLIDNGFTFGDLTLRRVAYYFSNGPFLRFWIRKGYDPRKDSESRRYQRVEFRVPLELRNYSDAGKTSVLKPKWKEICSFNAFPYLFQTSLQLLEVGDDYIQEVINKPAEKKFCTMDTGWFSYRVHDILRFCVAMRFYSVYPKSGAEGLLKAASDRFERSKRIRTHKNDLKFAEDDPNRVIDEGADDINREDDVDFNSKNKEDIDINESESDEDDDDRDETEVDDDDGYDIDSQSWSCGDGVSRDYLLDLFGCAQSDEEEDEGEYEIFEQWSDDEDDD